MADTIAFTDRDGNSVSLTLTDPFDLAKAPQSRDISSVHVPFTNVSFARDAGVISGSHTARGLETFSSAANADTFITNLEKMQGISTTVTHDKIGAITGFCTSLTARIDTNKYPGFHVTWEATFEEYE